MSDTDRPPAGDPTGRVRRWVDAGGTWRVERDAAGSSTVLLCPCTGGEAVERVAVSAADVDSLLAVADLAERHDP